MTNEEQPATDPAEDAVEDAAVGGDSSMVEGAAAPLPAKPPVWTHFLTPAAVLIGAILVAGAIWLTDDDGSAPVPTSAAQPALDAVSEAPTEGPSSPTTVLDAFLSYAGQVGLDPDAFRQCLGDPENGDLVNNQLERGNQLGVTGTPTFFVNDKRIVGAQPTAIFEEVIQAELDGSPTTLDGYSDGVKQLAATSPPRFEILGQSPDVEGAQFEGGSDAAVTIVEFSDFQCPFCQRWTVQSFPQLRQEFGDRVRWAFLHFPITAIHPNAGYASVAAICAGREDKFWEMHDLLFARQAEWAGLPVQ